MKLRHDHEWGRLEALAKAQPEAFRKKVRWVVAVGYGGLAVMLALVFGVCAGVFLALGAWMGSRGLLVPAVAGGGGVLVLIWMFSRGVELPNGIPLERAAFPVLFQELDWLCQKLQVRAMDRVLLTGELNAGVAQLRHPRVFGPFCNTLFLGLPLLEALCPGEMRAVLAHELAHLSLSHSRLLAKMRRLQDVWEGLLERRFWGGELLFGSFAQWYLPLLETCALVAMREQEFAADRLALQLVDASELISAKVRVSVLNRTVFDDFASQLVMGAKEGRELPDDTVSRSIEAIRQPLEPNREARVLRGLLAEETSSEDSHPSPRESIVATGFAAGKGLDRDVEAVSNVLRAPKGETAAGFYLTGQRDGLLEGLDDLWMTENAGFWAETRDLGKARNLEFRQLEERLQEGGELSVEDLWKRAELTLELRGEVAAMPRIQEVLARDPNHAGALFTLGYWKLREAGDVVGASLIERAMEADANYKPAGSRILAKFARQNNDAESIKARRA